MSQDGIGRAELLHRRLRPGARSLPRSERPVITISWATRTFFLKPTLDFSGWPIYTHRETADMLVRDLCRALEASKERIPWSEHAPLPLAQMVRDTSDGHLEMPHHPAAEKFCRDRGYYSCG